MRDGYIAVSRTTNPSLKNIALFHNIRILSFVLTGAPFAYKTANVGVRVLIAGDDLLQGRPVAHDADGTGCGIAIANTPENHRGASE